MEYVRLHAVVLLFSVQQLSESVYHFKFRLCYIYHEIIKTIVHSVPSCLCLIQTLIGLLKLFFVE